MCDSFAVVKKFKVMIWALLYLVLVCVLLELCDGYFIVQRLHVEHIMMPH